jgi:hypothetical protein
MFFCCATISVIVMLFDIVKPLWTIRYICSKMISMIYYEKRGKKQLQLASGRQYLGGREEN